VAKAKTPAVLRGGGVQPAILQTSHPHGRGRLTKKGARPLSQYAGGGEEWAIEGTKTAGRPSGTSREDRKARQQHKTEKYRKTPDLI